MLAIFTGGKDVSDQESAALADVGPTPVSAGNRTAHAAIGKVGASGQLTSFTLRLKGVM